MLLLDAGMVRLDGDGFYRPTEALISAGEGFSSLNVANFQWAFLDLAREGLDAVTDSDGIYRFDSLPEGRNNLACEYNGGGLVVLIPRIEYGGGKTSKNLGTDTLRLPGRITGKTLLDGVGMGGIFCSLIGTSFLTIPDEAGEFRILGIPQGNYALNYSYPGLQSTKGTP